MTERERMLLEALEPFAKLAGMMPLAWDARPVALDISRIGQSGEKDLCVSDFRRAAKAFQEAQSGGEVFKCKARNNALPEPQDCDWPGCGCDPYADKVIAALDEAGALRTPPLDGGAEIYAQLKISNKPDYWKGVSNGVRAAVTWLHRRALEMNDPAARAILHKAGSDLGECKAHHSIAELEKLSRLESALAKGGT